MFGKQSKETRQFDNTEIKDVMVSSPTSREMEGKQEDTELVSQSNLEKSEIIHTVEKISTVISPYFIALIGLLLYKDNFFFGTTLIAVGIFSLLKISFSDMEHWVEKIKKMFVSTQ